jgi:hypothetical protein
MDVIEERYISNAQGNWRIRLEPDWDTKPTEFDCYSEADIIAWKRDEWRYVVAIVNDEDTGVRSVLGGVEYGQLTDIRYLGMDQIIETYFDDLRAEVVDQLTKRAAELTAQ